MRACLLLLVLLGVACTPARRKVDGNIVRDIAFTGNAGAFSGQNDYQLRSQMQQLESRYGLLIFPLIFTVEPRPLRQDFLAEDAYRLEVWYAHHGWFDARVIGWELRRVRNAGEKRAGIVDIRGIVEPGPVSVVRSLRIVGVGVTLQAVANAALRGAPIREGDPFVLEYLESTRASLLDKLRNHSHPYAKVELRMEALPEDHVVDVVFDVDPGIVGAIGPVELDGNAVVPDGPILQTARLESSSTYSVDALRDAQRRLFEMGLFSIVTVEPDLSDPTRRDVPIQIRVTESKFRTLRFGVGFDYDSFLPVARATSRLTDVNVGRSLLRAEIGLRAGVALDFAASDLVASRLPTWGVDLSLLYPRLWQQRGAVELKGTVEQDIYGGLWAFRRPKADLHLVYRVSDRVQLRVGPHVEQYTFLGEFGPRVQAAQQRLFGIESEEAFRYQLTALDEYMTWDWRDDPQRTTRGTFYSLWFREAVPLSDAGYGFLRATAEMRGYVPVRLSSQYAAFPITLVGRTRGTYIQGYAGTDEIPLPERAFLGGASSLRGFRPNQVGPYSTLCTYEEVTRSGFLGLGEPTVDERLTHYHLPSGGSVSAEISFELRYQWVYGVTLATFVDTGLLSEVGTLPGLSDVRASAGVGARYDTLLGPFRFDISLRPLYPEDLGPTRYNQCRPEDEEPRVIDFLGNFPSLRDPGSHPPFATVFFITFGEAI